MLLEISGEHLLHKFISVNLLASVLDFVDLVGFHLVVEPFDSGVKALVFVASVDDKHLVVVLGYGHGGRLGCASSGERPRLLLFFRLRGLAAESVVGAN